MIDKDVALTLFYIFIMLKLKGGKAPSFARATIFWNISKYFETLNIKKMSSRTQK